MAQSPTASAASADLRSGSERRPRRRRARRLRHHRRPREGDDLPLALPAGAARSAATARSSAWPATTGRRAPARARPRCDRGLPARPSTRRSSTASPRGFRTSAATSPTRRPTSGSARRSATRSSPVFYLEIPRSCSAMVIKRLAEAGLTDDGARRRREAVRTRPRSRRARSPQKSTSTSTSRSSTGSTTSSGRWAPTSSSICASPTR